MLCLFKLLVLYGQTKLISLTLPIPITTTCLFKNKETQNMRVYTTYSDHLPENSYKRKTSFAWTQVVQVKEDVACKNVLHKYSMYI